MSSSPATPVPAPDVIENRFPADVQPAAKPKSLEAYLAAARELLGELRADPAASAEVTRLADTVDQEMLLAGAVVCGYSGESFDTADHITPHWSLMLRHWPTLLTLAAAIVVVAGVATLIVLA